MTLRSMIKVISRSNRFSQVGTPTFDLVNGKSGKYYVLIRPWVKVMVEVMVSVLPVLVLTGRLMSDLAFMGRVISDHVLTGPVMSNLALTGRVMSDLALAGRVISDLALDWPETDYNFDNDLDTRTYLNVKFSAHSIYKVKSDGSHLKTSI